MKPILEPEQEWFDCDHCAFATTDLLAFLKHIKKHKP